MAWTQKKFEEEMTPKIDLIYRSMFGKTLAKIERSDRDSNKKSNLLFMDINLGIDTLLKFNNGSVLTFQEKSLRNGDRFNSFTFEYYNDPKTKDEGEWFKLAAQLYFCGYVRPDKKGYQKYWIINIAKLRTKLMQNYTIKQMESMWLRQNPPPAKANFFAIPFHILESDDFKGVVLYKNLHGQRRI